MQVEAKHPASCVLVPSTISNEAGASHVCLHSSSVPGFADRENVIIDGNRVERSSASVSQGLDLTSLECVIGTSAAVHARMKKNVWLTP